MTAMLHCLVGDIAGELRAALPAGWASANDDDGAIVDALTGAGLLAYAMISFFIVQHVRHEPPELTRS